MNTNWIKQLTQNGYKVEFGPASMPQTTGIIVSRLDNDKFIGLCVSFDFLDGSAIDMLLIIKNEWSKKYGKELLLYDYK